MRCSVSYTARARASDASGLPWRASSRRRVTSGSTWLIRARRRAVSRWVTAANRHARDRFDNAVGQHYLHDCSALHFVSCGMHPRATELIATLELQPHPEGGFYRELFRSATGVTPADGRGTRAALTTIYFLLT